MARTKHGGGAGGRAASRWRGRFSSFILTPPSPSTTISPSSSSRLPLPAPRHHGDVDSQEEVSEADEAKEATGKQEAQPMEGWQTESDDDDDDTDDDEGEGGGGDVGPGCVDEKEAEWKSRCARAMASSSLFYYCPEGKGPPVKRVHQLDALQRLMEGALRLGISLEDSENDQDMEEEKDGGRRFKPAAAEDGDDDDLSTDDDKCEDGPRRSAQGREDEEMKGEGSRDSGAGWVIIVDRAEARKEPMQVRAAVEDPRKLCPPPRVRHRRTHHHR